MQLLPCLCHHRGLWFQLELHFINLSLSSCLHQKRVHSSWMLNLMIVWRPAVVVVGWLLEEIVRINIIFFVDIEVAYLPYMLWWGLLQLTHAKHWHLVEIWLRGLIIATRETCQHWRRRIVIWKKIESIIIIGWSLYDWRVVFRRRELVVLRYVLVLKEISVKIWVIIICIVAPVPTALHLSNL